MQSHDFSGESLRGFKVDQASRIADDRELSAGDRLGRRLGVARRHAPVVATRDRERRQRQATQRIVSGAGSRQIGDRYRTFEWVLPHRLRGSSTQPERASQGPPRRV
jgi:hypothetical protein